MLFPDCTVLSGTAMSAQAFVAAALGEPAPSHVRVQRRTLYVARPADVAPGAVICGLAEPADDHEQPRLLAPGEGPADLVLAVADGTRATRWPGAATRPGPSPGCCAGWCGTSSGWSSRRCWR